MQNKKAQRVLSLFMAVVLIVMIFSLGFITEPEKEDKITGAVSGMEKVSGDMVKVTGQAASSDPPTGSAMMPDGTLFLVYYSTEYDTWYKDSSLTPGNEIPSTWDAPPTLPSPSPPPACFLPTTPVTLSDGTKKQIQNIKKGDKVLSYDLKNKKPVVSTVLNVFSHLENEYLIVNDKIKVTPYHNMYINGEWKQIGNAKVGDYLMDYNRNKIKIKSIKKVHAQKGVMVYDLEIDKYHYYFAEGVLVHNSAPTQPSGTQFTGTVAGPSGTSQTVYYKIVDGEVRAWDSDSETWPPSSSISASDGLVIDPDNKVIGVVSDDGNSMTSLTGIEYNVADGTYTITLRDGTTETVTADYKADEGGFQSFSYTDADGATHYINAKGGEESILTQDGRLFTPQGYEHQQKMERREYMAYQMNIQTAFPIQYYIEEWLGEDIGNEGWREWGGDWGYVRSGYETKLCDDERSRYFIQDYAGHYATDGGFPTLGAMIYAHGRRSEYRDKWSTTCPFDVKWFPIIDESGGSAGAKGYLYKISWYIGYPFNDYDVETWSEEEREERGLEENGSIKYKIELRGEGCSAESLQSGYTLPMDPIPLGKPESYTIFFYDKSYMKKICIVFDEFEFIEDEERKKEWCSDLTSDELNTPPGFTHFPAATAGGTPPGGGAITTSDSTTAPSGCPTTLPSSLCSMFGYT